MSIEQLLLIITTICTGLITGLLYSFEVTINPALAKLDGSIYIKVMQSINQTIQNPLFFVSFLGTVVLLPLSTIVFWNTNMKLFLIVSTFCYLIGVFGITVAGNVPLNTKIANYSGDTYQDKIMRKQFEGQWNFFHSIRTIFSLVSFLCLVITLV
jgi:uncharacterized membrane protein